MEPTTISPSPAALPVTSAAMTRRLTAAVVLTTAGVSVVIAGVILLTHRPDWWPALLAAAVVALLGAIASTAVLSMAAGRTVDWLVTFVMAAAGVRMAVSLVGLLVCVQSRITPPEPTAYMICGFYAAVLIVESMLLARSVAGPVNAVGGTHV